MWSAAEISNTARAIRRAGLLRRPVPCIDRAKGTSVSVHCVAGGAASCQRRARKLTLDLRRRRHSAACFEVVDRRGTACVTERGHRVSMKWKRRQDVLVVFSATNMGKLQQTIRSVNHRVAVMDLISSLRSNRHAGGFSVYPLSQETTSIRYCQYDADTTQFVPLPNCIEWAKSLCP